MPLLGDLKCAKFFAGPDTPNCVGHPNRLIPRNRSGVPLLNPTDATIRERLLSSLDTDTLFDEWYARFGSLQSVQSAPRGLEIPLKRTIHTGHLDRMEDFLSQMMTTTQILYESYEAYGNVVQRDRICDDAFPQYESAAQPELWQDLLQDILERLEDLYILAFAFVRPTEEEYLPLEIYKNIGYARSWLDVAWKQLVLLESDGSFGKVREPETTGRNACASEPLTLGRTFTTDSECSLNTVDFLIPSDDELDGLDCPTSFLRRSKSILSRLGRLGRRK